MKITVTPDGKKTVKISKTEWRKMGENAGWLKGNTVIEGTLVKKDPIKETSENFIIECFEVN